MPSPIARVAWLSLRSLLALLVAATALVGGAWASGEVAALIALPRGGTARLAWDLGGVVLAGTMAFALLARLAPAARKAHLLVGLIVLACIATWAVVEMGGDFPRWFNIALLASLPVQAMAGGWLGTRRR